MPECNSSMALIQSLHKVMMVVGSFRKRKDPFLASISTNQPNHLHRAGLTWPWMASARARSVQKSSSSSDVCCGLWSSVVSHR
mmetsp:Transcript_12917/g.23272  ORF Transcript_12917/g.23272 Transcript_12917/m.23272 type:complete len:83 (-) Transcript_12917:25-273(-)